MVGGGLRFLRSLWIGLDDLLIVDELHGESRNSSSSLYH